jgi:hypothetical protein
MSQESDALRVLVRELLAEALAGRDQVVSISNDAELNAFAARLLELFEQPEQREALRAGRVKFRLAAPNGAATPPQPSSPDVRIEAGALTEKAVMAAAADGKTVVLGRRAVVTPLALDKARSLGVAVRREAM